MTQRLACDAADLFAAAAPMAFPHPVRSADGVSAVALDARPHLHGPHRRAGALQRDDVRDRRRTPSPTGATWTPATGAARAGGQRGKSYCETYSSCASHTQVGLCSITAQAFPGLVRQRPHPLPEPRLQARRRGVDLPVAVHARRSEQGRRRSSSPARRASGCAGCRAGRRRCSGPSAWATAPGPGTDGAGTIVTGSWSRPRSRAKRGDARHGDRGACRLRGRGAEAGRNPVGNERPDVRPRGPRALHGASPEERAAPRPSWAAGASPRGRCPARAPAPSA